MNAGQPNRLFALVACVALFAVGLMLVGFGEALGALREIALNTRHAAHGGGGDAYGALKVISMGLVLVGGGLVACGLAGGVVMAVAS